MIDSERDPARLPGIIGRYLAATVIGVGANLALYLSLVGGLDVYPPAANLIAALAVIGPRFWLHKIWVWRHRQTDRVGYEAGAHGALTVAGLGLSTAVAWVLARANAGAAVLAVGNVGAFGVIWVIRFGVSHLHLFVEPESSDPAVDRLEPPVGQ